MLFRKSLALFLASFALTISSGAVAAEPLTTTEMRVLSSRAAGKKVKADLVSILRSPGRIKGMTVHVGDVWMHGKAYATEYKGLCQRDTLSLYYAPVEDIPMSDWHDAAAEVPVRPYKIQTATTYRFVSPPKPEYLQQPGDDQEEIYRSPFAAECAKADKITDGNEWSGWFSAPSPEKAMEIALVIPAIREWAKVKNNELLGCAASNYGSCKNDGLDSLSIENPGGFAECSVGADELCFQIGSYGEIFTIRARKTGESLTASDIISVERKMNIIVT
jgi:hypothetical protein